MIVLQTRFEHLLNELRRRRYRLTPQRMELLRLIISSGDHPNAAQLYEQIKGKFPTMSLATVYKTLDLLKELGEVVEINLHSDNHFDAYQPNPHLHLICTSCKKILDGDLEPPILALLDKVEHFSRFQIQPQQIVFYGLCPDCQKNIH